MHHVFCKKNLPNVAGAPFNPARPSLGLGWLWPTAASRPPPRLAGCGLGLIAQEKEEERDSFNETQTKKNREQGLSTMGLEARSIEVSSAKVGGDLGARLEPQAAVSMVLWPWHPETGINKWGVER